MTAGEARQLLQSQMPAEKFGLNRIYRFYRLKSDRSQAQQVVDARTGGCDSERCPSRRTIQWKEHLQTCATGMRVGVIDTDVDLRHPAFKGIQIQRETYIPRGRSTAPSWHGTGVLSLLAGHPGSGTPGLIPTAQFYVASIFFIDDNGEVSTDTESLLRGLDAMSRAKVRIVNMSFTGPKDDLVQKAVATMGANGYVMVAAAGNEGPAAPPGYPAAYRQVIAVTAVSKDLRSFPYANRGAHIDVAAPGVEIWTAVPNAREGFQSGTSFAAPHATAVFATVLNAAQVKRKEDLIAMLPVTDLGPAGPDPIYGRGLLRAPESCNPSAAVATSSTAPAASAASLPRMPAPSSWTPVSISVEGQASNPVSAGFRQ